MDLTTAIHAAQQGNKAALETVVLHAQGYIYNLALRMLQSPADAEDATQDILIKLVTHLSQYRGESTFNTWVYRLATNNLLNMAQRDCRRHQTSFDDLTARLELGLHHYTETAEDTVANAELVEEVRRNCTLGMLNCLTREDRLALILGEVYHFSSTDAAYIMDLTPTAYRQRLSRARKALVNFVATQCGIVNPSSPCRCHKHVAPKIYAGLLNPAHLDYAHQPHDPTSAHHAALATDPTLDVTGRTLALMAAHPTYTPTIDFRNILRDILNPPDPEN